VHGLAQLRKSFPRQAVGGAGDAERGHDYAAMVEYRGGHATYVCLELFIVDGKAASPYCGKLAVKVVERGDGALGAAQ
jgi:hypothetical protein